MKCVAKMHEYSRLGSGNTTLVNSASFLPIFKNGGVLTITDEGYRLTTREGETVKRGRETNIFPIIKALDFDVQPLQVIDEIRDVILPFEAYQQCYDFGNVIRDYSKKRRYYAYIVKDEENGCTGIGIAEKYKGFTYAIHSIYVPSALNKYERAQYLVDFIVGELYADEVASVQAVGAQHENVKDRLNKEHIRLYGGIRSELNSEEVEQLAKDAIERRETISERFEEAIKFEKGK